MNNLRVLVLGVGIPLLIVILVGLVLLDGPAPVVYYKLADPNTLIVGAETGPALWPRVTGVTETETAVTVAVRSIVVPFVATGGIQMSELTVNLSQPLGDRQVVDSVTRLQAVDCTPPSSGPLCEGAP